jgi:hypothetical protein
VAKIIYDIETYPNCFLLCAEHADTGEKWKFEISPWKDESRQIVTWVNELAQDGHQMVGFNNLGFDYPVVHMLCRMGRATARQLYEKAMAIIKSENKFEHLVYPSDRIAEQIDLFKIHHFDNKARSTSLKALEFNMRLDDIRDLPFPVGVPLNQNQIKQLADYCAYDVTATKMFYQKSLREIEFRQQLVTKFPGKDVLNYSDVKLGKMIFQSELEGDGVQCYTLGPSGREPKQTPRPTIRLADCIPPYIHFEQPEFNRVKDKFQDKVITETKGAFKDLTAKVGGLDFIFGTGGLHASVEAGRFFSSDEMMILDVDVTSMYPSIAIENILYPEHLGPKFVEVYQRLKAERMTHPKGSVENAALKLALNGVYGASGDKFSIFYDPLFTMRITVSGQLMLAMLAEQLLTVEGLKIIQVNTDGVTSYFPRSAMFIVDEVCRAWSATTRLLLERVEYRQIHVADVNSYLAQDIHGNVKRKGRYEYDVEWHQNASSLVIPKVAEKVLLEGCTIDEALAGWTDMMDFMLRVKVPRSSSLMFDQDGGVTTLENTQRYYISEGGGYLRKVMPPLPKKPTEWRSIGINTGFTVCPCNNISDVSLPINFDWYRREIETLVYGVM